MKIILSKHAEFKFQERKIDVKMVEDVLENYEHLFYDIIARTMVAIFGGGFYKKGRRILYSDGISNKEGKRWIRV
jgi:hypothetical protein